MQISVFGLGKVGVTLSSCLSAAGNNVIGVDVSAPLVDALNGGSFQTQEPGVMERLARTPPGGFTATLDPARAVSESELSFVIVPTPSNTLGGFSLRYVLKACDEIGAALRTKSDPHTVAIVSTVLPGSSDARIIPCLEQASGRAIGEGLGYCYNPSFIALGEIVKGIEQPDYLLIGQTGQPSGETVLAAHRSMMRDGAPIARMSPAEAEITKIASNTHETMRVSFANMLFSICSEVPGADVDRITEALAHRMGKRFFKGAAPYGGPCWPRDNVALTAFMDAIRTPSRLPQSVDLFNSEHGRSILRKILSLSRAGQFVGILGLAYKPGTPSIERSFAMDLAVWLRQEGRRVVAWDPLAMPEALRAMGDAIRLTPSAEDCLRESDLAVIANPLREFSDVDWSAGAATTIVDCWRCLSPDAIARVAKYVPLGRGPAGDVAAWIRRRVGDDFEQLTD
jgi:UDPglucose 6-dehydrogenase